MIAGVSGITATLHGLAAVITAWCGRHKDRKCVVREGDTEIDTSGRTDKESLAMTEELFRRVEERRRKHEDQPEP